MDKRLGAVEKKVVIHELLIGELGLKTNGIETRLLSIETNLLQIKYSLLGALALFIVSELGLLGALKVMA
jgi:hypothetical protein|tara:strand:- start:1758 stop:1967 length:210 start_codon:yes stop_codon:yes gene_type:complete